MVLALVRAHCGVKVAACDDGAVRRCGGAVTACDDGALRMGRECRRALRLKARKVGGASLLEALVKVVTDHAFSRV